MKAKSTQQPKEPKTLTKSQFITAIGGFRNHCYKTYCQDCEFKGKNHAVLTCFERYMLEEVYKND